MPKLVPRPALEAFVLEHYRDWSIDAIAARFNVTRQIVCWRMIRLGLSRKPDKFDGRRVSPGNRGTKAGNRKSRAEKPVYFNVNERENWLL